MKTLFRFVTICSLLFSAFSAAAHASDLPLVGDAHVNATRTTTNYGTSSNLYVGNGNTSYLQFDTSALPTGTTSGQVSKATLLVFVNRVNTASSVTVSLVSSAWTEAGVTYATKPTTGTAFTTFSPATPGTYIAIDVTSAVQGWVAGTSPNFGLALGSAAGDVLFDAKENDQTAHAARLDVTLTTTQPTLGGGSVSYGTGTTGSVSVNNGNPLAPVISATLPTAVQSLAVSSTTGNTTASVTVDTTTTPTIPKITVNFPVAGASAGSAYPNVELNTTVVTTQTLPTNTSLSNGSLIAFSATNNTLAALTGGNTWDGSTFTVGTTGAGAYQFNVQMHALSTANASTFYAIAFYLDRNGDGVGGAPGYVSTYYTLNSGAAGERNNSVLTNTLFLAAGDKIRFYGSASSSTLVNTTTDGSSNLTITRIL